MGGPELQGSLLSTALGLGAALTGIVAAGFSLYLLTLAVAAAAAPSVPRTGVAAPSTCLAVLVPAHDEELLIGRCIRSLFAQTYPRSLYRVLVVADNCTDATAATASAAGAEVMVRDEPSSLGKGQALRWALNRLLATPDAASAVVVVDADSIAGPDLLSALERRFATGCPVVQADYSLLVEPGNVRSALIAAGMLLFHRVRFAGRARLGMAANLVGNGMLFSTAVLRAHPWDAFSGVEDLEYSMRLRVAGVRPTFAPDARIEAPGAASGAGRDRQRLRWEGGRFHVVRMWLRRLVAAAVAERKAELLDAAIDLATPPLGLLALATIGGTAATGLAAVAHLLPAWAVVPWAIALVAIPAYVWIGLYAAGAPGAARLVIVGAPTFLAWKVITYVRLLLRFDPRRWDRSDRAGEAPAARSDGARVTVGGVPIDPIDMTGALSRLQTALTGGRLFQVSTVNLDFIVRAQRDSEARRILQRTDLNLADGAPVVWLGRLLGARMSGRVAGADLVPALMATMAASGGRVFLLGGENGAATIAAARLLERYPGLVVAGVHEPPRAALDDLDSTGIIAGIREARPDVLLVAFGNPKQERWIDMHRAELPVSVAIGVGCVFDLMAGRSRRAPRWMQNAGLEWAYRLGQEPRRLLGRYLRDAAWLIPITAMALRSRLTSRRGLEPA